MKIYCPVGDYVVTGKLTSPYKQFNSLPIENEQFVMLWCQSIKVLKIQHFTTLTFKSIRSKKKESDCEGQTVLKHEGQTYIKNKEIILINDYLRFFKCKEAAYLYIWEHQKISFLQTFFASQKFTGSICSYENNTGRLSKISTYYKGNLTWVKFIWSNISSILDFFYKNKKTKMIVAFNANHKKMTIQKFTGGIHITLPPRHNQRTLPYLLQYDIYFKKMKKLRVNYRIF
jgi:hypothetical protein